MVAEEVRIEAKQAVVHLHGRVANQAVAKAIHEPAAEIIKQGDDHLRADQPRDRQIDLGPTDVLPLSRE